MQKYNHKIQIVEIKYGIKGPTTLARKPQKFSEGPLAYL